MSNEAVEALQKAVEKVGGQHELARQLRSLGFKSAQSTINACISRGCGISPKLTIGVSVVSGVHYCELRPDIYPPEIFKNVQIPMDYLIKDANS